jgi:hypothetical protein
MKHIKSMFTLALVGSLFVGCAAPTEEGAGPLEESAALEEGTEIGTVSSAANLLTACRPGDRATTNRASNYQAVPLPKEGVFSICRKSDGTYYSAVATTSPATLGLVFRSYSTYGGTTNVIRLSAPGVTRFEQSGSAAVGMIDCTSFPSNLFGPNISTCPTRTSN